MIRTKRLIALVKLLDQLHPEGYRIYTTRLSEMPGSVDVSIGKKCVTYRILETNGAMSLVEG